MPPALAVTLPAARLFLRCVHRLDDPWPDCGAALAYHGYIQIDPINVCGRMHDLILRHRVAGYREGDLLRFLHGDRTPLPAEARTAFEHHVPGTGILVAFPLDAWPHLRGAMRTWSRRRSAWGGRLTPREAELAEKLLATIAERGPLGSEDFEDDRSARRVWGAARLVKATLQKLFFHGRLLIAQRANNRRRYDLPERVLPAAVLGQPEAPADETARWLVRLKLRQRRLATLTKEELHLVVKQVQPVRIAGCPTLYCLPEDAPLLERCAAARPVEENGAKRLLASAVPLGAAKLDSDDPAEQAVAVDAAAAAAPLPIRLLAPLDPIIYDRRVTKALWGFDYTWEAYTPAAKRVRGYYALPVLSGTELVGHVDPKADRAARKLRVVSRRVRRGHATAGALREFAAWLGLK